MSTKKPITKAGVRRMLREMGRCTETIQWIPVEKSLPDDESTVLICVGKDREIWFGFLDAGIWVNSDASYVIGRVTHWALPPEGPR